MKILIQNSKYIASNGEIIQSDILIENGKITKIEKQIDESVIEKWMQQGCLVSPGFIDLHVHLREPGGEKKNRLPQEP